MNLNKNELIWDNKFSILNERFGRNDNISFVNGVD